MSAPAPQPWRVPSPGETELAKDAVVARIAAAQHGVVARRQLEAAGLVSSSIARRVADGRLIRLHRGVYAVTHETLRPEAHRLAAVLACGDGAVLSHRSAGEAWGLCANARARHEVTTAPGGGGRALRTVDAYRHRLYADEVTVLDGVPITTVARTQLDLATVLSPRRMARAIERSELLGLFDLAAHDAVLRRAGRRTGTAPLRAAIHALRPDAPVPNSELERFAVAVAHAHGLPTPTVNGRVLGEEADLYWEAARLNLEVDGWATHRTRTAYERDRARDRRLQAAGIRVVRVTAHQLRDEPAAIGADLARLLGRYSAASRPP